MADITKDSFNEANDFTKVVFQRGRDLLDFELNEFQDILRVFAARLGQVGVGRWQIPTSVNYVYSSDNGLQVTANGVANQVVIGAGTYLADGVEQAYTTPLTVTLPAADVTVKYDVIYAAITEVEVADPNAVPQLGPTTVRRQLTVSINNYRTATLPIDGSMPANPATWLWQGQTRYFALAVVTRPASNNTISDSNILDLRLQTPSRTLAEAARVEDFTLQALITPVLETPVRNASGIDNALLIDINKANSAVAVGLDDTVTFRSRANGGVGIPQTMAMFTRYAATTNGVPGRFALGTNYALYGTPTLRFQDDYVVTGYGGVTDKFVRFSSNVGSGSVLRLGEQSAAVQNAAGVLSAQNMLKALNGRVHVSVGDGVQSFGDFTGQDAIEQALAFYAAALTAGATVSSFEIDLKRGTYIVAASPGAINIAANTNVTIAGDNAASTVIQVPSGRTSGISVSTGATLTLKNLRMTGGSSTIPLMTVGTNATVNTDGCQMYSDGYGVIVQGATALNFRRTEFKAVTGVGNIPLVELRVGYQVSGDSYVFEGCTFNTLGQVDVPVIRVRGTGTYTADSSLRSIVVKDCVATLGGATMSAGSTAWNPSCINTGLIDLSANNANREGTSSFTWVESITISGTTVSVQASATATCLPALRVTMNPTGDFSGSLFTAGFIYLGKLTINGLDVRLTAGTLPGSDVSPIIIGLYQTDIDIDGLRVTNATTTSPGLHSGKLPYDAYTYMTPTGTVAAAPNSGAAATNAVAGYESSLVFIANRWLPTRFYALVQADLRLGRQALTRVNNVKILGIERGSDSVHTASGELTIVAQDTVASVSNVVINNYFNTAATTRVYTPEHRVRLRPISIGSSDSPARPTITFRDARMCGFAALQGAIAGGSITNGGTGYTSGFYAGIPLTGGGGNGATANITVTAGVVTSVVLARTGNNYAAGNVLSATLPSGVNFTYTVSSVTTGSAWLYGQAFVTRTAALQSAYSTNTGAYLKVDPVEASSARVTLESVTLEGYQTYVVAQSAAIGCFSGGGLELLRLSQCYVDRAGDGIRIQIPASSSAYHTNVSIEDCTVARTNMGIVFDGGDGPGESVIINDNDVNIQSANPAFVFAASSSQFGGQSVVNNNTFQTANPTNIYALFLCDTWPANYVMPTVSMVGNSCSYGTAAGYIKINNAPTTGGGSFPTTGHVWKTGGAANALCVGLETIDTPYNSSNGELHYIDGKYMVHNNARFKVGP